MKRICLLALCLLVSSCAEPAPTDIQGRPSLRGDELSSMAQHVGLLTCSPLPYDSVTQSVGPMGGTIAVSQYQLTIPAGALDSTVAITAVAPSDTINLVQFGPAGLQFAQSARLTMSYANCDLLGSLLPKRVAYVSDGLSILDYLPSLDQFWNQEIVAHVDHFSGHAVAW